MCTDSRPKRIGRADIVGARIVDVHAVHEKLDGWEYATVFFTVDRGFSFTLPWPGHEWLSCVIPENAEKLPDEYWVESVQVKKSWLFGTRFIREPSTKRDDVARLKSLTIAGVYCYKPDEEDWSYEGDDAILLLSDGSQARYRSMAPPGVGAGLIYLYDPEELAKLDELQEVFDVPEEN